MAPVHPWLGEPAKAGADEWASPALAIARELEGGKGRGLVLVQPVAALDVLIVGRAFVVAPVERLCSEAMRVLDDPACSPRRKAQFLALYRGTGQPADIDIGLFHDGDFAPPVAPDSADVKHILEVNAQDMSCAAAASSLEVSVACDAGARGDQDLCGVWLLPSLLNHSCLPNTSFILLDNSTVCVFAARDLQAGEELTDSYTDLFQPLRARQAELRRQKGFLCGCGRCAAEAAVPEAAVGQLLDAQARADAGLRRSGPPGMGQWLEEADHVSAAAGLLAEAAGRRVGASGAGAALLRAALLQADISAARVLHAFVTAHDAGGLSQRGARACLQAASLIEAVAPWSVHHIRFLWLGLQLWLRAGAEAGPAARATAAALVVAWSGRHGVALGWPRDLRERCLAFFGGSEGGGAAAEILRAAVERVLPDDPEGLARVKSGSELSRQLARHLFPGHEPAAAAPPEKCAQPAADG